MVVARSENAGRKVLITGGTGSFGSTVTRGLLGGPIDEIRILSRDEAKQDDMRRRLGDNRVRFYVGDVRTMESVREAMDGVDYVFHAAALKQVPSCEFFPLQAVATNVHGSDNVIRAAHEAGVKSVVCLSTDKAVYPVNAMGMSKAMMERVAMAFARNHPESHTTVSVTRYGNVMYSRGSVIPLFVEQVRAGKPMTITNPNMTRFLMSLDESVALVQYAFENAQPGDLFIRKAPASTIEDLAKAVAMVMGVGAADPGHRHPARGEDVRVAAVARGDGRGRGSRRLLPGAAGRALVGLRAVRRGGRARASSTSATTPPTTPNG